ncbi:MAG: anhydro-N-acetylmuramic acid kinase [Candidatus Sericytochromatia bacterium]|nr:anhydro-N-acetylmuramic acid kinase [Candidatus Sericytochromatia bacterium]
MRVLGLMSGTSLDGVDACLIDVFGAGERLRWEVLHACTTPLPADLRQDLEAVTAGASRPVARLAELDARLARAFAEAARGCAEAAGLRLPDVAVIGSHGQTLWHQPGGPLGVTWQAGSGAAIAALTGVTTVSDFRSADVALGGQGAPLVPYVDRLIAASRAPGERLAFQNMGGIGNVTWLEGDALLAFDTGPGNRLIDACVAAITGGAAAWDEGGDLAARGSVDEALVTRWLQEDPFLRLPPPRSTGREHYDARYVARLRADAVAARLTDEDLVATVTAFSAATVADGYRRFLPGGSAGLRVFVSGGGARNASLMRELAARLAPATVSDLGVLGVAPAFKEAFAFALLAHQAVQGVPTSLPGATGGGAEPWVLGSISPGRNMRRVVLAPARTANECPTTEAVNPDSIGLDTLSATEAVAVMHAQDWEAVRAVGEAQAAVASLVTATTAALRAGGRLFYLGAGTSGRLGVLDASECPPTYSTPPDLVQGLIAGGDAALRQAVEGAEDDEAAGATELRSRGLRAGDVVVGLSANGGAPYVRGALQAAQAIGAVTALVTCNPPPASLATPDHVIVLPTGPELVSGSTRLKAGTATKLVLNMITTLTMVALGKVHDNLMVDLTVSNQKLRVRAERLLQRLTGLDEEAAGRLLRAAGGHVKLAVVMHHQGVEVEAAGALLVRSSGRLRPWLRTVTQAAAAGT